MTWPEGEQWQRFLARSAPGTGHGRPDDAIPGTARLRGKSVPNVPTERLQRRLEAVHTAVHTPEGLHAHDDTRRALVNAGLHAQMVRHELRLRGVEDTGIDCKWCG